MARPPIKAQQFADLLAERISDGTLPPGTWLPAERNLAEEHKVGRSTVRQAVQLLVESGHVEHVPGSGAKITGVPTAASAVGADARGDLAAIHNELRQITSRLDAIEANMRSR